jgi:DNA polymerase-1
MAGRIGIGVREARDLVENFSERFPNVGRHKAQVIRTARKRKPPYSVTMIGRRRYLGALVSRDDGARSKAERQAYNHVIQGTAADILKVALVRTHQFLPEGARIVLTVHDEIVVTAPDALAEEALEAMREAMEGAMGNRLGIPLIADIHIGDRWGEAKAG